MAAAGVTRGLVLLCLFSASSTQQQQQASELRLEPSGEYRRLLVFLEEDLETRPVAAYVDRVARIKSGFQRASDLLEELTSGVGRRRRLGDVSVLVSARLGRALEAAGVPVTQRLWQRRDRADFVVTADAGLLDEGPVAVETGCGRPGRQVVLSAESLGDRLNHTVGRKIALFFSQYRWGLLSEQPIGSLLQPVAGGSSGSGQQRELRLATCSLALRASARIRGAAADSRPCLYDANARTLSPNCSIEVDEVQSAGGSLVTRFCESESPDPRLRHNRGADSASNRQCGGLGAADVVRLHPDYRQPAAAAGGGPSAVDFQVVAEARRRRVVVVMDTSGSMNVESRITKMVAAVSQFLTEVLEEDSECALISFTETARVLHPFARMESLAARRQLAGLVSGLLANGGTCIGGAVIAAMQLLGMDASRPSKRVTGQIILLSDGEDGCPQSLEIAVSLVSQTSIEVVTIRYGDQADARMGQLAERSGGRQFFGETASADISSLRLSLAETTVGALGRSEQTLTLSTDQIGPGFRRREFLVDASVRRDLAFTVSFPASPGSVSSLRLLVRAPSGREFGPNSGGSVYRVDAITGSVTVTVPDAHIEAGQWTMENVAPADGGRRRRRRRRRRQPGGGNPLINHRTSPTSDDAKDEGTGGLVIVTGRWSPSRQSPDAPPQPPPVTLTAEVVPATVAELTEATRIGVHARLLRGYSPVTGAVVFAAVRSNAGQVARISLSDAGVGADLKANDGTYSGYLPVASVNQERDFSVTVTVTAPVSRVASAGRLTVARRKPDFTPSLVPPTRVTDLRTDVSVSAATALLVWTTVEDPGRPGVPLPLYTICCSESLAELTQNFSTCEELLAVTTPAANNGSRVAVVDVFHRVSGRGRLFLAVAGVSAAVTGPASNTVALEDLTTPPPSAAELARLGFVVAVAAPARQSPSNGFVVAVVVCVLTLAGVALLLLLLLRWRRLRRQLVATVV